MKIVNLELTMPTVDIALDMLKTELRTMKSQKRRCLKLIHGYGSSGKGGKIRVSVRRELQKLENENAIDFFIIGENFSIFDANTRKAFLIDGELRSDEDLERHNNGVTFVII